MKLFEDGFLSHLFTNVDVGVDLGTSNLIVFQPGRGIVYNEPSVVAIDRIHGQVVAVGRRAKDMMGKAPDGVEVVTPMTGGVVADYEAAAGMLGMVLARSIGRNMFFKPRLMVSIPAGVTNVEKRAVLQACTEAGAAKALLLEEPLAAAIGAGLNVNDAIGTMIVNIGGGTTDVAVISLGDIVVSKSLRMGGSRFDEAIKRYLKREFNVLVSDSEAEEIKFKIGTVSRLGLHGDMMIRGRDNITGLPTAMRITSRDTMKAMAEPVSMVLSCIRSVLEKTPPELAGDIVEKGITLTGGGALLDGLADVVQSDTHIKTKVADKAMECVAIGAGKAFDNPLVMEVLTHYRNQ
jgi:rod shape-determining protein MreB